MNARRKRLTTALHEALVEHYDRESVSTLRRWRDESGKSRALLFGEGSGENELPHFCIAIEHSPTPTRVKVRGRSLGESARQALHALRIAP